MKEIILRVTNQKITYENMQHIVTDSKNYIRAVFEFSSEWDGMKRTAIFKGASGAYCVLLQDNACIVPYEVLVSGFSVSVFGVLDNMRITTDSVYITAVQSGFVEGETPAEPTPTVYEQLLGTINEIKAIDSEVKALVWDNAEKISVVGIQLDNKVDKVNGKGLSSNDFTDEEKAKLAGLEGYDATELEARITALEGYYGECDILAQEILNGEV